MATNKFSEKDFAKADAALDQVVTRKKPVVIQWIEQNIDKIDGLQEDGASLRNIFLTVNESVKLGVSYATFQRYVQFVRKEKGSPFYSPKAEKKAGAWACGDCEPRAVRQEKNGKTWWVCPSCGAFYADDAGTITQKRLPKKA